MRAHPDEHHALEQIAALLRAAEPHLAAMFSIFTRLTAHEGPPPDEDRVGPVRRPGRRPKGAALAVAGPAARSSTLRAVLVPTLLLAVIVVIITVALSGTGKCTAPDRASVFAYQSAHVSACAQASTKKTTEGRP